MNYANILSIDSCNERFSVVLLKLEYKNFTVSYGNTLRSTFCSSKSTDNMICDDITVHEEYCYREKIYNMHVEKIVSYMEEALRFCHIWYSDISHIVVNVGPGSFTGTKIGLSCAESINLFIPSCRIFPVTSIESILYSVIEKIKIYLLSDGLKNFDKSFSIGFAIPCYDNKYYVRVFEIDISLKNGVIMVKESDDTVFENVELEFLAKIHAIVLVCYRETQLNSLEDSINIKEVDSLNIAKMLNSEVRNEVFSVILESNALHCARYAALSLYNGVKRESSCSPIYLNDRF